MKYTLKQIADTAKVSKTTVRRHRDKIPESIMQAESCKEGNIIYYSEVIAERIFKSLEEAGTGRQSEQDAENSKSKLKAVYKEISDHTETTGERAEGESTEIIQADADRQAIELYKETNEAFKTAINSLTEQLKRKDEQIEQLNELIKQQMELLNAQEEARKKLEQREEEQSKKKKSLFSRIFRKKAEN